MGCLLSFSFFATVQEQLFFIGFPFGNIALEKSKEIDYVPVREQR